MVAALLLQGVLVTYAHGTQIGRETFRDDGATLTSEVSLGPQSSTVTIARAPRRVVWRSGDRRQERDVPPGTIVLENGSWQAYALAAEWFPDAAEKPLALKMLLPGPGATVDVTLSIKKGEGGVRTVEVAAGPLRVTVEIGPDGRARHAAVPQQGLEARPESAAPAAPASVIEEPIAVRSGGVKIAGVVWRPRAATGKVPVVLIVHGSGSQDRDGPVGLYRALAEQLAARGIATARYDKRGLGDSGKNFDFAKVVLPDFIGDATEMARALRNDPRFSSLTLAGHSEGALIGTVVATRVPLDHLILIAGGGRPYHAILREQVARQLDAAQLAELDRILAALRENHPVGAVKPPLDALFPDAVIPFFRSELSLDPAALLRPTKVPATIVQGETDVQITVADARLLAAARPDAKLILIPKMNHLLKEEPVRALPQASYTDGTRPIVPGLIDAIVAAIPKR